MDCIIHSLHCLPPHAAGLFYFDASYRPVPLEMQFVGVSERNVLARLGMMDEVCYQKVGWKIQCAHIATSLPVLAHSGVHVV